MPNTKLLLYFQVISAWKNCATSSVTKKVCIIKKKSIQSLKPFQQRGSYINIFFCFQLAMLIKISYAKLLEVIFKYQKYQTLMTPSMLLLDYNIIRTCYFSEVILLFLFECYKKENNNELFEQIVATNIGIAKELF